MVSIKLHMAQISYDIGPFMAIDDKGGEIWTKIWNIWTKRYKGDETASMDMEQHWRIEEDQNSWTREAHK